VENLKIGYPNRIDASTVSGGSWLASLPLSNIKDRRLSRVARSTNVSLANTIINIDLGSAKTVGAIALVTHNLSSTATVKIRGDDAADFATPLYDSGWVNVYGAGVIPSELLEWEDDNFWLGTVSSNAIAGYQAPFIKVIDTRPVLRYWRIEINDTSNVDAYVQIGRVFIGDVWTTSVNYSYGAGLSTTDETQIETSLGGEEYFDVRKRYREFKFELQYLTESEGYSRVIDMYKLAGVSGEILMIQDSSDVVNGFRRNFLCRLKSISPLTDSNVNVKSVQMEVKEIF